MCPVRRPCQFEGGYRGLLGFARVPVLLIVGGVAHSVTITIRAAAVSSHFNLNVSGREGCALTVLRMVTNGVDNNEH